MSSQETAAAVLRRVARESGEDKGLDYVIVASRDVGGAASVHVSVSAQFSMVRDRQAHSDVVLGLFAGGLASLAESTDDPESAVRRVCESALRIVRRDPAVVVPG